MTEDHAQTKEETLRRLGVALDRGLDEEDVKRRRQRYGPNRLRKARPKSPWRILAAQFNSVIVWLLGGAAALSLSFGQPTEGAAILAVLVINSATGFATELKAVRSMEALRRLSRVRAKVRRAGKVSEVPADEIVPGDIVLLEGGDVVAADLRLVETANLECDESTLTGESVPVAKMIAPTEPGAPLAERSNMAFKGTAVTRGSGAGVASATGMATELGRISALAEEAEPEASPLEKRLDRLGGHLVFVTLGLAAFIAAAGVYTGKDLLTMVKTAVALAVAAVPEGLPIVATVALARGMWRMARRNALIEKLSAVETLGATTVILTDKTGTLTENRMEVVRLLVADGDVDVGRVGGDRPAFAIRDAPVDPRARAPMLAALRVAVLCNNASLSRERDERQVWNGVGDPMEVALLRAGRKAGLERPSLLERLPEAREEAFDAGTKMMATFHKAPGGYLVAVKGAPEAVIARCSQVLAEPGPESLGATGRDEWRRRSDLSAADGLRMLALATKQAESERDDPYESLTLLGLVGLLDPPRADVAGAIAACREAGVRVVMLTGDHAATARKIAMEVGLADEAGAAVIEADSLRDTSVASEEDRRRILQAAIFARISPKTKLDLVSLYQASGNVVAMTGDGVNDAPALKKADIGIAMGRRGTEVAREAADMVLRDDAFASIVAAMHQGRVIFGNIRKFVVYLMSCNLSEILVIGIATLIGLPLPLLPLQILYLNLVTDVFPAFALGVGEGEAEIMRRPPRDPKEPILGPRRWASVGLHGASITAATLAAFALALREYDMGVHGAVTISFLTLALAQLWHVFNMRDRGSGLVRNEITRNPYIWGALALCTLLVVGAVHLPGLSAVLGLTPPSAVGWALAAGASLAPLALAQMAKVAAPSADTRRRGG